MKSTFQQGDTAGAAQAQIAGGRMTISVESGSNFPDGAVAVATVAGPDGQRYEVPLNRVGADRFEAQLPAVRTGTYAVGVNVTANGETVLAASTLANESYPAEYALGESDAALMDGLSQATGGRGEIEPKDAWETSGLKAGFRNLALAGPFLLLAALLWPLAVALSRLSMRGATLAGAAAGMATARRRVRAAMPRLNSDPDNAPAPTGAARKPVAKATGARPAKPANKQTSAVNELLAAKRARRGDDDASSAD